MFGPLGVDTVNARNEVVSTVVWYNKKPALKEDPSVVTDCTAGGSEKFNTLTMVVEWCVMVTYEVGYVIATRLSF